MLTAEKIEEFLIKNLKIKREKISVKEMNSYFIIIMLNTRNKISIQKSSTLLLFISRLARLMPKKSIRTRDIVIINKIWGSIDSSCIMYIRRKYKRLICTGRPEAVDLAIKLFEPDILTTIPWDPSILGSCRDKEILMYYTSRGTKTYICKLRRRSTYPSIFISNKLLENI